MIKGKRVTKRCVWERVWERVWNEREVGRGVTGAYDHQCRNPPRTADIVWVGACTGDTRPKAGAGRPGRAAHLALGLWSFYSVCYAGGSLPSRARVKRAGSALQILKRELRWNILINLIGCFDWCTVFGILG